MSRIPSSAARAILTFLVMAGLLAAGAAFAGQDVGSIHFTAGIKSLTSDWSLSSPPTSAAGNTVASGKVSQPSLGVELTWGRQGWPALVALDVLHSYDDGVQGLPFRRIVSIVPLPDTLISPAAVVRRRASTLEIGLGARRSWLVKGFSPYLGAGGTWVRGTVRYQRSDTTQNQFAAPPGELRGHDTALGFWVGGGIYRRLGPRFQMGIRGRYSQARLTIPESTVLPARGGYSFPGRSHEVEAGGRHLGLVIGWSFPGRK